MSGHASLFPPVPREAVALSMFRALPNYAVTSAKHFQWLKKKLGLVVEQIEETADA